MDAAVLVAIITALVSLAGPVMSWLFSRGNTTFTQKLQLETHSFEQYRTVQGWLQEKTEELDQVRETMRSKLDAKDTQLAEMYAQIRQKDNQLIIKDTQIQQQTEQIASLTQRITPIGLLQDQHAQDLLKQEQRIANLSTQVAMLKAEIIRLRELLAGGQPGSYEIGGEC